MGMEQIELWDAHLRAGMALVDEIAMGGAVLRIGSLPLPPTQLFHVEHSPTSRVRHSDPDGGKLVDMERTNTTECSTWNIPQDSPLQPSVG